MRRIRLVTVQRLILYSASSGAHGNFSKQIYEKWLKNAERKDLAQALGYLAQINQTKLYLFWEYSSSG
jgi:hypothetical protein